MDHTKGYFDRHKPRYSQIRIQPVVDYLRGKENLSILEIGCGDAISLKRISEVTKNSTFFGIESSESYIKYWPFDKKNFICRSILEDSIESVVGKKFDLIIVPYLLHHLVGKSRSQSLKNVNKCLHSAKKMLNGGGHIIILEPTFEPYFLMTFLFYIKKIFSVFTGNRVGVFGYWNNIGPPVVSYLDQKNIKKIIYNNNLKTVKIVQNSSKPSFLMRFFKIKRGELFVVMC